MISAVGNRAARRAATALVLGSCLWIGAAAGARAATTEVVRDDSFDTLQEGELEGLALSSDGFLFPSYARSHVGDTGAEIIWSAVEQPGKGVLCATGHDGKLVRINEQGQAITLADLPEPEITAAVALRDGSALIAAAPTGRIYRLGADDKLTTLAQLTAKFVWDLEVDDSNAVWAATGPQGHLYKISSDEKGVTVKQVHAFNSHNITDIWIDRAGKMGDPGMMYVAGQDPGWLYRFNPAGSEVTILFDSAHDEIRALQPSADGLLLAANTERSPTPQALTMAMRLSGAPPQPNSLAALAAAASGSGSGSGGPSDMGDVFKGTKKSPSGTPSSALILLTPDGFSRTVWQSPERPIHSIAINTAGNPLVAAGSKGRLFEVLPRDAFALVADLRDDFITRIIPSVEPLGGWLLAGARNGGIQRMFDKRAKKAVYRSRAIDGEGPAKWGMFYFSGALGEGGKVSVSFRKGSTDQPEIGGWQDWSTETPLEAATGSPIPGPAARYLQYRLTFESTGAGEAAPRADYMEMFYQRPNYAPKFRGLVVGDTAPRPTLAAAVEGAAKASAAASSSSAAGGGSSSSSGVGGSPTPEEPQGGGRAPDSNAKNMVVSWSAEDPNQDKLIYALYYKADNETVWKLVQDELRAPRLPLGVGTVGDGRYRFRVVASDALDNPPGAGLEAEMISDEVVIDNTPPVIESVLVTPQVDRAQVKLTVRDALSFISSISADLDGDKSYPILPVDGLYDQSAEAVDWTTLRLKPGEHTLTLTATDRRGNTAVTRAVFTTTAAAPTP